MIGAEPLIPQAFGAPLRIIGRRHRADPALRANDGNPLYRIAAHSADDRGRIGAEGAAAQRCGRVHQAMMPEGSTEGYRGAVGGSFGAGEW